MIKSLSRVSNNEADDDLSSLSVKKANINVLKETLSMEMVLLIAQYLTINDLNSFGRCDQYLLEMIFDLTVEKVEAISRRKQELFELDIESRIVSVKDQYKDNENALSQTLIWKPLVLYHFPNYSSTLNVKNWMHIMRRRVIHLQNKFPHELPLSKVIPSLSGSFGSKFRANKDRQFIENCEWEYECPLKNSAFRTVSKGVSYCSVCKENVYEAINAKEFERHVKQGHCVSFSKYLIEEKRTPLPKGRIAYRPVNNH